MPAYEDQLKRFESRMEEKKAKAPVLHEFSVYVEFKVLAENDEHAEETLKIIEKHLEKFDDIKEVKGKFNGN